MTKLVNAIVYIILIVGLTAVLGPLGFVLGLLGALSSAKYTEQQEKKKEAQLMYE